MPGLVTDPDVLIVLAVGSFVTGYLVINQIALRLIFLVGTGLYIAYYMTAAETPLWAAVYGSLLTGSANVIGLASLLLRRTRWSIPRHAADLYQDFEHLPPGDFALLARAGTRRTATAEEVLTHEGAPVDKLVFLIRGAARMQKSGTAAPIPDRRFVGEVAYTLGRPASATVTVAPGADLMVWDRRRLDTLARRKPRLKLAFDAALSRDMAAKVADGFPTAPVPPDPTPAEKADAPL